MLETVQIIEFSLQPNVIRLRMLRKKKKMEFQGKKCQGESERERLTRKNLERKSKNKRDSKLFYSFVDIALLLLFQRGLLRELMFWSFKKKRPLALLPIHSCLAFVHWIGFPTVIWRAKR